MTETTASEDRIPELEYRAPDCPMCGDETTHDGDSLNCPDCDLYWPDPHGPGQRIDDDKPVCGVEVQPWKDTEYKNLREQVYRCVLTTGHHTLHAGTRADKPPSYDGGVHQWGKTSADRYPAQITVFCDECGVENTGDYHVSDDCSKETRLGYAREFMRTLGWRCDETGDWCPKHAHLPDDEEREVETPREAPSYGKLRGRGIRDVHLPEPSGGAA